MRRGGISAWLGICALGSALAAGCAALRTEEQAAPRQEPAAVARAPEPRPPAATLDPREERRLVKELLHDVDDYYRLLEEKNVEQASAYVVPERREAFEADLWEFVARYKIESADVMSYELFPQPGGVTAKVKVQRVLFEKRSVDPEKSETWMTWHCRDGEWSLVPQEKN